MTGREMARSLELAIPEVDGAYPVLLREIDIGRGALGRLGDHVRRYRDARSSGPVVVLVDGVAMTYAGSNLHDTVIGLLAGEWDVRTVVVSSPDGLVHADVDTIEDAVRQVSGASVLVTVGSGTLADIGKAVCMRLDGLLHVVVQTALSVNGFADDQSVLLVNGVKRTTPTRWPDVLIADTDVLRDAPSHLNAAGIGDLMAMFTAPADWLLATRLEMGAGYSQPLVAMVREHGPELLRSAPRLRDREPDAIEYVARVLTLSGISMGMAGATAPASGAEHTISHLMEMAAAGRPGSRSAFHGAQVGAATVLAALVWTRVRSAWADPATVVRFPAEDEVEPLVRAAFNALDPSGQMAEECWRQYRTKLARWNANREFIRRTDWAALDVAIAPLLAESATLVEALTAAGAPTRFGDLDPPVDRATVRWALANCHLMRDRFTVVDLAFFLGVWNADAADAVLAEAARIGGGP